MHDPKTDCCAFVEHIDGDTTYLRRPDGVLRGYDKTEGLRLIEWSPLVPGTWIYSGDYDTLLVEIGGRYHLVEDPDVESVLGNWVKDPFYTFEAATKWLQIDMR